MINCNDEIFKNLCVVSAPSGTGKTSLIKKISSHQNISVSISETTRNPRTGEVDGVDYVFVKKSDFESKIKNEQYIEYAQVHSNYYGTVLDSVVQLLEKNIIVFITKNLD